ncbi:uncharacterized protein B0J16DRAFT_352575 [Fusarium flagelliforme]|uniref:uncharacterized protein n=1 Tax=Fusarium flagelliforme TaxID=2675880 RepID=UPI001E8D84A0|nr:uncharacterized protein B0J16DRAFT_352575 [Fusarium flagelliforme]KAH7197798.1 hypothetical protein B0J16DRAFT_352575 [Fusarium flagelliforme]
MLSLKGLLNPAPQGENTSSFSQPNSPPEFPPAFNNRMPSNQPQGRVLMSSDRAGFKDANLTKSKLRGQVRFPPYERLDEVSLQEIRRHRVTPFGYIHEACLHIPYNSGKKDFFEKTGRESFEVFKYEFVSLENGTEYAIMWDYNIGLVRMTPFFKCLGYGKTIPAKMLGLNPGLKEITHSITGGAIAAQGYWMPYQCAKAICATFCHPIAGALIPIFGPDFPAICIPPGTPEYARMVINRQIVIDATQEADTWRMQMSTIPPKFPSATSFPRDDRNAQPIYPPDERRNRHRPRLFCDPSWAMEDPDRHYLSAPDSASSTGSGLPGYMVTSRPGSSWTSTNRITQEANPWVTAIPGNPIWRRESNTLPPVDRLSQEPHLLLNAIPRNPLWPKRRFEYEDSEYNYRRSVSPNMSISSAMMAATPEASPMRQRVARGPTSAAHPARQDATQQDAALLLLSLSHQEQVTPASNAVASPPSISGEDSTADEGHRRSKRKRGVQP